MLQHLRIQNYAIIEKVEINFEKALNIITGETGAGKSILLGALSILLGDRFDKNALYDENQKCIIEAEFDIQSLNLKAFFERYELDYDDICSLRREVNTSGRSRSFINDTPVNLKTIRALTAFLIDIHSQNDILDLKSNAYQLDIIDIEANHEDLIKAFGANYNNYKASLKEHTALLDQKETGLRALDYIEFVLKEFEDAKLDINEEEELVDEQKQLENVEQIQNSIESAYNQLDGSPSAIRLIEKSIEDLQEIIPYIPALRNINERLISSSIELKDIVIELEQYKDQYEVNPSRLETVQARLNLINGLQRKHQVKTIEELLVKEAELSSQVAQFRNIDKLIHDLKIQIQQYKESIQEQALKIRSNRQLTIKKIEKEVNKVLPEIGMPFALFKIELKALDFDQINTKGLDHIEFTMSPDKGNKYGPLNKIASGGELSRIMLCLKSIVANSTAIPTLIFDEIDTGISGDIASKVANLLKDIASKHQIISITHLPQIAAKGNHHLFVSKSMINGKTVTNVDALNEASRIEEIATMLSGKAPTPTAIKTAKELIKEI
jgi:DNA repair protein RecN (Recombination protein N)